VRASGPEPRPADKARKKQGYFGARRALPGPRRCGNMPANKKVASATMRQNETIREDADAEAAH
jgi:hypothetical protein